VLDHKAAFTSYARDYGLAVAEAPHEVKVTAGNDSLTATFDEHNRLTKLEGTVAPEEKKKPAQKPAKKPAKAVAKKPAKPTKKLATVAAKKVAKKPAKKAARPAKKPAKKR
jgi:hypothetical protein